MQRKLDAQDFLAAAEWSEQKFLEQFYCFLWEHSPTATLEHNLEPYLSSSF